MQFKQFIGIDVSKNTLDITVLDSQGNQMAYEQTSNNLSSIKKCFSKIQKETKISLSECLFCMEYTGIYNLPLVQWLSDLSAHIWMESGAQILKSQGVVRGKSDKVDSLRIAKYAFLNRNQVRLWKAPRAIIQRLASLMSLRRRLIKIKSQLSVGVNEQVGFLDKETLNALKKHSKAPLDAIKKQIEKIEIEILEIIKSDERIHQLYKIITSVDGVGLVTATHIIVTTNEFINITDGRKYACYSGVVPFEHRSGTSIRGKNRVSHMANKKIKTLLHLAAISAIRVKGDLKEYYERKVAEGKHKMSVLNAIRNKIVLRIFACVTQERMFEKKINFCLEKP
jgi:transposase